MHLSHVCTLQSMMHLLLWIPDTLLNGLQIPSLHSAVSSSIQSVISCENTAHIVQPVLRAQYIHHRRLFAEKLYR
jgi:hypothetical protein